MRVVEWIGRVLVEHINFLVIVLFHGHLRNKFGSPLNRRGGVCCGGACCAQVLWMKHTLLNYDLHYDHIKIFCDNTSTIHMTKNANQHSKTKYIEIRYHFLRDHFEKGILILIMFLPIFNLPIFSLNHLTIIDFLFE